MIYHVKVGITGISSWFELNKTRDEVLTEFVCPFIKKEITLSDGKMFNMSSFGYIVVYKTNLPVSSDWPIKKATPKDDKDKFSVEYEYEKKLEEALKDSDITSDFFKEAIILIDSGKYRDLKNKVLLAKAEKKVFFICPFGNKEVDHNYEFAIKPAVEKHGYTIRRVDEISSTREITKEILDAIEKSTFIIADLTDEKPNCYYEVGYAHSLGKPVIIIAKKDVQRHFDISGYKWNYWENYEDLKPTLEKEVQGLLSKIL